MKKLFLVLEDLFQEANQGIAWYVLAFAVVPAIVAFSYGVWWLLLVAAAFAAGFVWMFKASWNAVDGDAPPAQNYTWGQWIAAAGSEDEARSREEMASSAGWSGLPPVNIDGTPMIEGTGVDIYGRAYGDNNDYHHGVDAFSSDTFTAMDHHNFDSHSSSMGMDSHHHS